MVLESTKVVWPHADLDQLLTSRADNTFLYDLVHDMVPKYLH